MRSARKGKFEVRKFQKIPFRLKNDFAKIAMSYIEDVAFENENRNKQDISQLLENDDNIAVLKENIRNAQDAQTKLVQNLKKKCLASISISELVEQVLENFDETGEYLGFEETHLQCINDKMGSELEEILITLEKMVGKVLTDSSHFSAIHQRRYNIHLIAMLFQILQIEGAPEQVKILLASLINNLCDFVHDWSDLTRFESEILQEVSHTFDDVPDYAKKLFQKVISSLSFV